MTKEILRCPGCGGRSLGVDNHYYYGDSSDCQPIVSSYGYCVECKSCGIRGPRIKSKDRQDKSKILAKELSIDKWNDFAQYSPKSKEKNPVIYHDDILPVNEEPATEKQMKLAEWISRELKIKIPLEKSKKNLMKFIGDNIDNFKNQQENERKKRYGRKYRPYFWIDESDEHDDPMWGEEYF